MFSEYIRRRAIIRVRGCERCLTQKFDIQKDNGDILPDWRQLDCAHIFSRKSKATCWDEDNALGLCGACHMLIDRDFEQKAEFAKSKLGEGVYELLRIRNLTTKKVDLAAVRIYLKQLLESLECG